MSLLSILPKLRGRAVAEHMASLVLLRFWVSLKPLSVDWKDGKKILINLTWGFPVIKT